MRTRDATASIDTRGVASPLASTSAGSSPRGVCGPPRLLCFLSLLLTLSSLADMPSLALSAALALAALATVNAVPVDTPSTLAIPLFKRSVGKESRLVDDNGVVNFAVLNQTLAGLKGKYDVTGAAAQKHTGRRPFADGNSQRLARRASTGSDSLTSYQNDNRG